MRFAIPPKKCWTKFCFMDTPFLHLQTLIFLIFSNQTSVPPHWKVMECSAMIQYHRLISVVIVADVVTM